jgi:hypothetical protein
LIEQLLEAVVPERVQVVALKAPEPVLFQVTIPVGVLAVPCAVSVTVAVHVVV